MLWARPAITILGIDCPPVLGSTAAIVPEAAARLNLRIPPGIELRIRRTRPLLIISRRWRRGESRSRLSSRGTGNRSWPRSDGPAYEAMASAMNDAYGKPMTTLGQGGSIPLCNVFAETYPDAELIMIGVEEPTALIHAPNESVAPSEIQSMALAEALFMQRYATARGR